MSQKQIKFKIGNNSNYGNYKPLSGEPVYSGSWLKIGDGINVFRDLPGINLDTQAKLSELYGKIFHIDETTGEKEELITIKRSTSSDNFSKTAMGKTVIDNEKLAVSFTVKNSDFSQSNRKFSNYDYFSNYSGTEQTVNGKRLYSRTLVHPTMSWIGPLYDFGGVDSENDGDIESFDMMLADYRANPSSWELKGEEGAEQWYEKNINLKYPNRSGTLALDADVQNLSNKVAIIKDSVNDTSAKDHSSNMGSGQYLFAIGNSTLGTDKTGDTPIPRNYRFNIAFNYSTIGNSTKGQSCQYNFATNKSTIGDDVQYGTALNGGTVNHTYALASGYGTTTTSTHQTVLGKFNRLDTYKSDNYWPILILGNGANTNNRNNALEVWSDSKIVLPGGKISFDSERDFFNNYIDAMGRYSIDELRFESDDSIALYATNDLMFNSYSGSIELSSMNGVKLIGETTIEGDTTIKGDLVVTGEQTIVNTQNLMVKDALIVANSDATELLTPAGLSIYTKKYQKVDDGTDSYIDLIDTYQIAYNPDSEEVELGKVIYNDDEYNEEYSSDTYPVALRSKKSDWTNSYIPVWDSKTNTFIPSGKTTNDLLLIKGSSQSDIWSIKSDFGGAIVGEQAQYALSIGQATEATANCAAAFNFKSKAKGSKSFAANYSEAKGEYAFSANYGIANGMNSAAFGWATADTDYQFAIGKQTAVNTNALFKVGNGTRSKGLNVFEVLNNGTTNIIGHLSVSKTANIAGVEFSHRDSAQQSTIQNGRIKCIDDDTNDTTQLDPVSKWGQIEPMGFSARAWRYNGRVQQTTVCVNANDLPQQEKRGVESKTYTISKVYDDTGVIALPYAIENDNSLVITIESGYFDDAGLTRKNIILNSSNSYQLKENGINLSFIKKSSSRVEFGTSGVADLTNVTFTYNTPVYEAVKENYVYLPKETGTIALHEDIIKNYNDAIISFNSDFNW